MQGLEGDPDVYVGPYPLILRPTATYHTWAGNDIGSEHVAISASDPMYRPGWFAVGVTGYGGPAKFTLRVETQEHKTEVPEAPGDDGMAKEKDAPVVEEGMRLCSNCGDPVPVARFDMHQMFCERHNERCAVPGCGAVVHKSEMEKHWHW